MFFFKQKKAYEMRISDWRSDVCSSDLSAGGRESAPRLEDSTGEKPPIERDRSDAPALRRPNAIVRNGRDVANCRDCQPNRLQRSQRRFTARTWAFNQIGRGSWRERGGQYG